MNNKTALVVLVGGLVSVIVILIAVVLVMQNRQSGAFGGGGMMFVSGKCKSDAQCNNEKACLDGKCVACLPKQNRECVNNEVYWTDSCGRRTDLIQSCGTNGACSDGTCFCQSGYIMQNNVCVKTEAPKPPPPKNTLPPPSLQDISNFIDQWKFAENNEDLYAYMGYYDSRVKYYQHGTLSHEQLANKIQDIFYRVNYFNAHWDNIRIVESSDNHVIVSFTEYSQVENEQTGERKNNTSKVILRMNRYGLNTFKITSENRAH